MEDIEITFGKIIGSAFSNSLSEDEYNDFSEELKQIVDIEFGIIESFNWSAIDKVIHDEMDNLIYHLELNHIEMILGDIRFNKDFGLESSFLCFKKVKKEYLFSILKKSFTDYITDKRDYEGLNIAIKEFNTN